MRLDFFVKLKYQSGVIFVGTKSVGIKYSVRYLYIVTSVTMPDLQSSDISQSSFFSAIDSSGGCGRGNRLPSCTLPYVCGDINCSVVKGHD